MIVFLYIFVYFNCFQAMLEHRFLANVRSLGGHYMSQNQK